MAPKSTLACYASPFLVKVEQVAYILLTVIIIEDANNLTSYIMRLTNTILVAEKNSLQRADKHSQNILFGCNGFLPNGGNAGKRVR
jgi:hypothetical protein